MTPGNYVLPAASVEAMYSPEVRARTDLGRLVVTPANDWQPRACRLAVRDHDSKSTPTPIPSPHGGGESFGSRHSNISHLPLVGRSADEVGRVGGSRSRPAPVSGLGQGAVVFVALALGALTLLDWLYPPPLARARDLSVVVTDRDGAMLRSFLARDGTWRLPVGPEAVDPRFLAMLKAYEDRRFDFHPGVDPVAAARALFQLGRQGRDRLGRLDAHHAGGAPAHAGLHARAQGESRPGRARAAIGAAL